MRFQTLLIINHLQNTKIPKRLSVVYIFHSKVIQKMQILDLKQIISRLFEVQFEIFDYSKYHQDLPFALKELYEIDAFFSKDCRYETIAFFCNLDRLVPYNQLRLEEASFVFVHENQHNWSCTAQLNTDKVYFKDSVEPQNSCFLAAKIDDFLLTFALQEIGFSLQYYFGFEYENMDEIQHHFNKTEHLFTQKHLTYQKTFSYYLADDDCLVMWAGMNVLATNNQAKFEFYKGVLKFYSF